MENTVEKKVRFVESDKSLVFMQIVGRLVNEIIATNPQNKKDLHQCIGRAHKGIKRRVFAKGWYAVDVLLDEIEKTCTHPAVQKVIEFSQASAK